MSRLGALFVATTLGACAPEGATFEPTAPRPLGSSPTESAVSSPGGSAAPRSPSGLSSAGAAPSFSVVSTVAAHSASAPPLPRIALSPEEQTLGGKTIDFEDDGLAHGGRARAYTGRVFVHEEALAATGKLPLVVFFHGLNKARIPHRWMGGGDEGDVRAISAALMASGRVRPFVLAAPGSVQPEATSKPASFPAFDFEDFVARVEGSLGQLAEIDRERVVVTGHSGAGCSAKGGILSALRGGVVPYALVSIDTCMSVGLGESLANAGATTHVVVTWQTASWNREVSSFRRAFEKERKQHPEREGSLRVLDQLPSLPRAHDATVRQTFDAYLPTLLGPP